MQRNYIHNELNIIRYFIHTVAYVILIKLVFDAKQTFGCDTSLRQNQLHFMI